MKELFKLIVVCLVGTNLVACTSLDKPTHGMYMLTKKGAPPKTVIVAVNLSNDCTMTSGITTQTTEPSCDFVGPDPTDIACQKASSKDQSRFIQWTLVTEINPLPKFTLEFDEGHPFSNINALNCRISTPKLSFTCRIRNNTKPNPLDPDYKYDVVFSKTCKLDPRIFLRR